MSNNDKGAAVAKDIIDPLHPVLAQVQRGCLTLVALVSTMFGLELWLQPDRWSKTPAYALLLDRFPAQVWGTVYLLLAVVMMLSVWQHESWRIGLIAHILPVLLAVTWWMAFLIRRITDDRTTIVNVGSWAVMIAILVFSITVMARRKILGYVR